MTNTGISPTSGVLLAGGAGARLGLGPKALLPFRGRTLVEELAAVLLDGGCCEVVVVLGAGAKEIRRTTDLSPYLVVENPDWASGMAGSFKAGVGAASAGHDVLVALVDQPGLTPAVVARLLAAHRSGRVTAAGYPEDPFTGRTRLRRGHPLIIDAGLRAEVAASAVGDAGARGFLKAHPGLVDVVDCGDLADGADVDTKAQLPLLGLSQEEVISRAQAISPEQARARHHGRA
ncbi:nicotine blue oxidoreductase [bacterium RCC_150]